MLVADQKKKRECLVCGCKFLKHIKTSGEKKPAALCSLSNFFFYMNLPSTLSIENPEQYN